MLFAYGMTLRIPVSAFNFIRPLVKSLILPSNVTMESTARGKEMHLVENVCSRMISPKYVLLKQLQSTAISTRNATSITPNSSV
jgi:hypothetical protein